MIEQVFSIVTAICYVYLAINKDVYAAHVVVCTNGTNPLSAALMISCNCSAGFNRLAFGHRFVLASIVFTWYKLCYFSMLPTEFPTHLNWIQFPCRNQPIHENEPVETLFIFFNWELFSSRKWLLIQIFDYTAETHCPLLFGLRKNSNSVDECQQMQWCCCFFAFVCLFVCFLFFAGRNWETHIRTYFMSAALCNKIKNYGLLVSMFDSYCHTTNPDI